MLKREVALNPTT